MQHIRDTIPNHLRRESKVPDADFFRERIPELSQWGISDGEVRRQSALLMEYLHQQKICNHCQGFQACGKEGDLKGFSQTIGQYGNQVTLGVERCRPYMEWSTAQRIDRWSGYYGRVDKDADYTFANYPEEQRRKYPRLMAYAEQFANTYTVGQELPGVYLFGPPGVGKTHLMLAVLNRLMERGIPCLFVRSDSIFDRMRQLVAEGADLDGFLDTCATAPILGIDEFAQERANEFTMEKLFRIINHRFHAKLPTWFTSNFAPPEIYRSKEGADILEAVAPLRSRVMQMGKLARLTGEDARQRHLEFLT